jgi:hypothetical protein
MQLKLRCSFKKFTPSIFISYFYDPNFKTDFNGKGDEERNSFNDTV